MRILAAATCPRSFDPIPTQRYRMRHFATLALAAFLVAPVTLAQTSSLSLGPAVDGVAFETTRLASSASPGLLQITQNSSLDVTRGTVACASSAPDPNDPNAPDIRLGSTDNSFYRVFDLSQYDLPSNAELTSVDFGVSISFFDEATVSATGQLIISTLPSGTSFETGFARSDLSEVASSDISFESEFQGLVSAGFDDPDNPFDGAPSLSGDELLVVELDFDDGSSSDERDRQYDARAGGNQESEEGASYLSTNPECGPAGSGVLADPVAFLELGDTFTTTFVVVLNVDPGLSSLADARAAGAGEAVTVEGIVTRAEGAFLYIQDETGGLVIRQTSGEIFDGIASGAIPRGSVVRVTGTLSEFRGLLQINNDDLESLVGLGSDDVPAPQVITLAELTANGEDYEGELVTISDVSFDTPPAQFEAGTNYDITDASGTGTLRIVNEDDTELDGTDFIGNPATVTGIVGSSPRRIQLSMDIRFSR